MPKNDTYWITVYIDTLYQHGNNDNMIDIPVSKKTLQDYVKQNIEKDLHDMEGYNGQDPFDFFLKEYDCNWTEDLPAFLEERNELVLPDSIKKAIELTDFVEDLVLYHPSDISVSELTKGMIDIPPSEIDHSKTPEEEVSFLRAVIREQLTNLSFSDHLKLLESMSSCSAYYSKEIKAIHDFIKSAKPYENEVMGDYFDPKSKKNHNLIKEGNVR